MADDSEVVALPEPPDDLQRATDVLTDAYEQARAEGYQAGSPTMQAMGQAEQGYQRARAEAHHDDGPPPADSSASAPYEAGPGARTAGRDRTAHTRDRNADDRDRVSTQRDVDADQRDRDADA